MIVIYIVTFLIFSKIFIAKKNDEYSKYAVVTLVTGNEGGYPTGALALGQSIIEMGSKLRRVVMVTNDVESSVKEDLSRIWEVIEVKTYFCNHVHKLNGSQYDLNGKRYQDRLKLWSKTCTKFAAWELIQFERVIFMDSDTLVVGPIDDLLFSYSNASFLAAPDGYPPDNFNSGVMVLTPSLHTHSLLLSFNKEMGSIEGGDQGILNRGLCPLWFSSLHYHQHSTSNNILPSISCDRIPFKFNVWAAYFQKYQTLLKMAGEEAISIIHFVSDGKPWMLLMLEYMNDDERDKVLIDENLSLLPEQLQPHLLWRHAYFLSQDQSSGKDRKKTLKNYPNFSYKYLASLPLSDLLSILTSQSYQSMFNQMKFSLLLSIHQGEYQIERKTRIWNSENKKATALINKKEKRETRRKNFPEKKEEKDDKVDEEEEQRRSERRGRDREGKKKEEEEQKGLNNINLKELKNEFEPSTERKSSSPISSSPSYSSSSSSCDCPSICNSCPSEQPLSPEDDTEISSTSPPSLPSFNLKFKINIEMNGL